MENLFYFNTKAQAKRFDRECRKAGVLVEPVSEYAYRIFRLDNIKDDFKKSAMNLTKKIFHEIMG